MKINKKLLIVVVLIAVVSLVGLLKLSLENKDNIKSNQFNGEINGVEEDSIFAEGVFVVPGRSDLERDIKEAEILIDSKTKITKILVFLPTAEELKATNGYFDGSKLKREDMTSSLQEIVEEGSHRNVVIKVMADSNIYGKERFNAREISYEVGYSPELDK